MSGTASGSTAVASTGSAELLLQGQAARQPKTPTAADESNQRADQRTANEGSTSSSASNAHQQPRTSDWKAFFREQSRELIIPTRSCSVLLDLADNTLALEPRLHHLESALGSLAEKPLDFNYIAPNSRGRTLLMVIIDFWQRYDTRCAARLEAAIRLCADSLADYDVGLLDAEGRSIFHHLACRVPPESRLMVVLLLEKLLARPGATAVLNQRDTSEDGGGCTPMVRWAHDTRCPLAVFDLLFEAGADPNIPDQHGQAVLHTIALSGNVSLLEHLVEKFLLLLGLDLFHRSSRGETFFEFADRLTREDPNVGTGKAVACVAGSLLTQWHQHILPHLKTELAAGDCTNLPVDLVDLALQYFDGHGPSWKKKKKKKDVGGGAELETNEKEDEEARPQSK